MEEPRVRHPKYGWRPDTPDHRDRVFQSTRRAVVLPDGVDLVPKMPPVWDQGDLGSCTSHALAAAFEYDQIKQGVPHWTPSRLFIYYLERWIEHTIHEDAGAELRDGAKALAKYGVCDEALWPYNIDKFAVKPPLKSYKMAAQSQVLRYARVRQTEEDALQVLAQGYPVVFGFAVYSNIDKPEVAKSGILGMPGPKDQMEGGHAVVLVGYDRPRRRFLVRNSWGKAWGINGYFWMPFDYVLDSNLADDFWVLYTVEDGDTVNGE